MRWRCMYVHRIGHPLSSWKYSSNSLVALLEVKSASIGALCPTPTIQIQMVDLTDHSSGCMWGLKGSTAPPSRGIAQGGHGAIHPFRRGHHQASQATMSLLESQSSWGWYGYVYLSDGLPPFLPSWLENVHSFVLVVETPRSHPGGMSEWPGKK